MPTFRVIAALAALGGVIAGIAVGCGDEEATVRGRLDGGTDAAGNAEGGALGCGVPIPVRYESAAFPSNAAVEIALAAHVAQIDAKMQSAEGASTTAVTAAELKALYGEGAPSLRAVSTTATQTLVDAYFDAFGAAVGKTWTPADAEQDGGAAAGGKYEQTFYFSSIGVDLRAAVVKGLLGGALYNHVLGLVAAPITESTIDRLLAAFGANPSLAGRTDPDAGADADKLIAEFASRRDDKASPTPGPYRQIKTALLTMKAAVRAGDTCRADLDAAVATFLREWERATFASAIYALSTAATNAANPARGPVALHTYGEALGFVQSFKGLPDRRKATDIQIDAILTKIGAPTAFKLVTNAGDRALKLNEGVSDIALYEGFTPAEVETFRKDF